MAIDPQTMADLVELLIKRAISPLVQRVRALEVGADERRSAVLDHRKHAVLAKAQTELLARLDNHAMLTTAGMHADGVSGSVIDETLAWLRDHNHMIATDHHRDLTVRLTVEAWTPSTHAATVSE